MSGNRRGSGFFRRQGTQPFSGRTGIEQQQGDPYGFDPGLSQELSRPLVMGATPTDQQQQNVPVSWISQTFNVSTESIITAQPNRVILVIQNQSSSYPMAVNFDQTASVMGASPNYTSQGIMLLPGVALYIDKWCPTGTVHVAPLAGGNVVPIVVTQGYSAIGNAPGIGM